MTFAFAMQVLFLFGIARSHPRGPSARESNLGESRRRIVTRVHARNASVAFPLGQKWPCARRTYKALILGRLFIRLLFNFPFLTCPFPLRRRDNPLFRPLPLPFYDGGLSRRMRERLKNKRPGKTRRKNPSRTTSSRGRPAQSFSHPLLLLPLTATRNTRSLSTVFPVTRERNSEHRKALHAISHLWRFNDLI